MTKKIPAFLLLFCLVFEPCFAQTAANSLTLPVMPGMEKTRPPLLRSLILNSTGKEFDLLLDKGTAQKAETAEIRHTAAKLLEYFLTGVSLPDSTFWVNLRPDGENNIIDPLLEKTDLGKVLLEADVALKKDLAQATSPSTPQGREYWSKLYAKAESLFGKENMVIPTLTRPWIVPGEIIIRQSAGAVYVYKAALKVQLEQDYLKGSTEFNFSDPRMKELNEYSSALIRGSILPGLTKKVNSAKAYAPLRQAYYSLILAQWFKRHFRDSGAQYADRIDTSDLSGLTSSEAWSKTAYFQAYRDSFSQGEYSRSERVNSLNGAKIRNYSCGGIEITHIFGGDTETTAAALPKAFNVLLPRSVVRLDASLAESAKTRNISAEPVVSRDGGVWQGLRGRLFTKKEVPQEPPKPETLFRDAFLKKMDSDPQIDVPAFRAFLQTIEDQNIRGILLGRIEGRFPQYGIDLRRKQFKYLLIKETANRKEEPDSDNIYGGFRLRGNASTVKFYDAIFYSSLIPYESYYDASDNQLPVLTLMFNPVRHYKGFVASYFMRESIEGLGEWMIIARTPEEEKEIADRIQATINEIKKADLVEAYYDGYRYGDWSSIPEGDGGTAEKPVGGVAFQTLPMTDTTTISPAFQPGGPTLPVAQLNYLWRQIRLETIQGSLPCLKIIEYIGGCRGYRKGQEEVATYVADILRKQEEEGIAAGPELKKVLSFMG